MIASAIDLRNGDYAFCQGEWRRIVRITAERDGRLTDMQAGDIAPSPARMPRTGSALLACRRLLRKDYRGCARRGRTKAALRLPLSPRGPDELFSSEQLDELLRILATVDATAAA